MAQVGAFPIQRRVVRGEVNPLDKATVVSIYPKAIHERKVTLFPGEWHIPAGSYENPTVFHVGGSSWFRDIDENSPILEIPVSSIQVAESIVKDYCNGILESNMGDRMPGLFYLPGVVTLAELKKTYQAKLDHANTLQRNWFLQLTKVADSLWARTNGNPVAISDDMRMAARELGLQDKAWLKDFHTVSLVKCVACGSLRDPNYPICAVCKTDHRVPSATVAAK